MLTLLFVAVFLVSCAPAYEATGTGPGTNDKAQDDYKACATDVIHNYYANTPFYERAGAGWGVGGAVGGAIGAATTDSNNHLNNETDECMQQKGYKKKVDKD